MLYLNNKIEDRIKEKLSRIKKARPLSKLALEKIKERFSLEMTYNSNAIEGNSLTLQETYLVINDGITIKGKPLKDHLEARGHKEALDYLYRIFDKKSAFKVSEQLIKNFHQLVIQDIDRESAGQYRQGAVFIGGTNYRPPMAAKVPDLVSQLLKWINKNPEKVSTIEMAALAHYKLVAIHPFLDGNGRTARLLMNAILFRDGYPLAVILKNDRKKYYQSLAKADQENEKDFVEFIAKSIERSLDIYSEVLLTTKTEQEIFLPLAKLSDKSKFSKKYLNLLARNGKLVAHKKGRIWFSSEEALKKYLDNRERKRVN